MIGAIIGDIIGSRFEWNNIRTKEFELITSECRYTDDSVMTFAVAKSLIEYKKNNGDLRELATKNMRDFGTRYEHRGYGGRFKEWLYNKEMGPYNSCGNGSAMRISSVAYFANSLEEVKDLSRKVTDVTHNHPDGIKGAECIAVCIYMALHGATKDEIKNEVVSNYYPIDFTVEYLRNNKDYFDVICSQTVPQAVECFYESNSFIDAIRNAICITGDSDTLGAIVGSIAESYYGIDEDLKEKALEFLPSELKDIYFEFLKTVN